MKTIKEIRIEQSILKVEKLKLEKKFSDELTEIISEFINNVKVIHGSCPKSINVEFINTRAIGDTNDNYIMQEVKVYI